MIAAEPHSCHGFEPPQPHLVTLLARAAGLGGVAAVRFARSGFKVTGRGSRPVPLSGDARPRFSRRALCCGTRPVTVTRTHRPMSVFSRGGRPSRDMWSLGVCCQVISIHSAFSPSDPPFAVVAGMEGGDSGDETGQAGRELALARWRELLVCLALSVCLSVRPSARTVVCLPVLLCVCLSVLSVCPYCCPCVCLPACPYFWLSICLPARPPACVSGSGSVDDVRDEWPPQIDSVISSSLVLNNDLALYQW